MYAAEQLQAQPNFNAAAFQRRLQWATLGSTLLSAAALPSTQAHNWRQRVFLVITNVS